MYRQHLKKSVLQDVESNKSKSEFVNKVTSIPIVYLAWNLASDAYHSVKSSNAILRASLSTTEKAALFFSSSISQRFERQLQTADHIACRGLETIQEIVPMIRSKKEKLYKHSKELYEDTVETGLKKYEVVRRMGTDKAADLYVQGSERFSEFLVSPYGEVCEVVLDFALECGEMYVDYYLPPLGDERPEKLFGDRGREPVLKRAQLLRERFKERFYKHSLLKIQSIKLHTKYFIINIYHFSLQRYIVEISSAGPNFLFSPIIKVFTNILELMLYLSMFYRNNRDDAFNV